MAQTEFPELPGEWGGKIPSAVFLEEARRIVAEADAKGLVLRAMGGVGIRLHSQDFLGLAGRLGRLAEGEQEFTDLDFMAYRREREQVRGLLESLGYSKRRATLSSAASERQIYFHPNGWFFIDVFFDRLLVANHPLDFRGRLELDSPTIPLTDLLLEKLQIVTFSEKDLKDALLLLAAHSVGDKEERETIDSDRIARLLASDWGFWYTVTTNLKGIRESLSSQPGMTDDERVDIRRKVEALLDRVDREPKTTGWKLRAAVGARKRWYQPVETTETVGEFGIWRLREEPKRKGT